MPANIAYMVIAHKALALLQARGFKELADFARLLDDPAKGGFYQQYMNLGSVGPDLYYYVSMAQSGKEMLLEGFVDAAGVTPWSYHLHSQRPQPQEAPPMRGLPGLLPLRRGLQWQTRRGQRKGPGQVQLLRTGLPIVGRLHPGPDDTKHAGLVPVLSAARVRRDVRPLPAGGRY